MDIKIVTLAVLSSDEEHRLTAPFQMIGPVKTTKAEPGIVNIWELLLPTVFTVIFTEVTAGFLKQIGADLEKGVKDGISGLFERGKREQLCWYGTHGIDRKEPALVGENQDANEPEAALLRKAVSPPLRVVACLDADWHPAFIFPYDLAPEMMEAAILAMRTKLALLRTIADDLRRQQAAKLATPERFFGTMPPEMVRHRLIQEDMSIRSLLMGRYVYDSQSDIWILVA
jgi:hypothetical protein